MAKFIASSNAQSIFELIDYCYRFSTEKFIVPITGCKLG